MIRGSMRRVLIVCTVAVAAIVGGEERVSAGSLLKQWERDNSCGPRCLWALMQLTGAGKADCDIECIYELIERPVASPVNLKDLRDAATELGVRARGEKLDIAELKEMNGYAILAVGNAVGTEVDPLHFVLTAGVVADQVLLVDTRALTMWAVPLQEVKEV